MSREPRVTVVTPTYNRPAYLPDAIRSVLGQDMADWEMFVVNDGGEDVRAIVEGFHDDRIIYVNRQVNTGKAACLNYALAHARGEYVAYLDDDDMWYANHLSTLTGALDEHPEMGVAYSDLYRVVCIADGEGRRYPLQKQVEICRDYNRTFMFHFNHTLHVSLMHRRELALQAGGYNEDVRVLIDWNLTRKLSFYADFIHVPAVTGEYYAPIRNSDRISDVQRANQERYRQNLRRIRADLPPEPWPKVAKVAVVFPVSHWDRRELTVVGYLADMIDYPCRIVLVNRAPDMTPDECRSALGDLAELGHIRIIASAPDVPLHAAYLAGVRSVEARYYYLPSENLRLDTDVRIIRALGYVGATGCAGVRWAIDGSSCDSYDVFVKRESFPTVGSFFHPAAVDDVRVMPDDWTVESLETDLLLCCARECEKEGNYAGAKALLDEAAGIERGGLGRPYLVQRYLEAAFHLGDYDEAEQMCRELISQGYGADNWVRLGEILQRQGACEEAVDAYRQAFEHLGLTVQDLERPELKLMGDACDAFRIMIGQGECLVALGRHREAAPVLRKAARLRANSHRPSLAFGRIFLEEGDLTQAEEAFKLARAKDCHGDLAAVEGALAQVYERQGRTSAAYWACRSALDAAPRDEALLEQAIRLCTALRRRDEMEGLYRRFLTFRPGHVPALRSLAEMYRRSGRAEEARELTERAELLAAVRG